MAADRTDPGTLYLVATPIGNLDDISLRALRLLSSCGLIAAEDTRHTRKLLSRHAVTSELISYRDHNHRAAADRILAALQRGMDVALVTDAGTPGISDPGGALVAEVLARGHGVVPVPGPCAAIAALSASGLPTDRFLFVGFLPRKDGALRKVLQRLADEPGSLVFYESPRRLGRTLARMASVLGPRQAVVVRELTKVHETFDRGTLDELAGRYVDGARGEVTLVVAGCRVAATVSLEEVAALVQALRGGASLPPSEIARLVSRVTGLDRNQIYDLATRSGREDQDG